MTITDRVIHESLSFKRLVQLAGNRTPFHAYLLVGRSMATLLLFARAFAAWLHCSTAEPTACGACKDCQLSRSETHPALQLVRPEGNELSIDAVRAIIDGVDLKAAGGRHRVFIVEKADAMGEEAANAFLKTLEEPPPRTVFLLLTDRPDAIIPTIASRCLATRINVPAPEVIIEDFLPAGGLDPGWTYLSLLLTNSSLESLDGLTERRDAPRISAGLPALVEGFLGHVPPNTLLASPEPFAADVGYPLALFQWLVGWLVSAAAPPTDVSALSMALTFLDANEAIGSILKDHFKQAERDFTSTYGKGQKDPNLDSAACRRRIRRLMTQHTVLVLECLQVAIRLGLALRATGSLPYHLERLVPELGRVALLPDGALSEFRHSIDTCRRRLFANVTEKLILMDLFSTLQRVVATYPARPSTRPEGGP